MCPSLTNDIGIRLVQPSIYAVTKQDTSDSYYSGSMKFDEVLFFNDWEELQNETELNDKSANDVKGRLPQDGPPDDIRGFFGHPLAAATSSFNGDDSNASAKALLHEYINLPSLDKSGMKIGETISSVYDILRADDKCDVSGTLATSNGIDNEILGLLQAQVVDKFLNQNPEATTSEAEAQAHAQIQQLQNALAASTTVSANVEKVLNS